MDGGHLIENIHEAIPAGERARLLELFLSAVPNSMPAFPARPGGGESEGS
jgi:hypothetical protein